MIAIESFKRFRIRDIIVILVLSGIWALLAYLINNYLDPQKSYIFSLLIGIFLMTLTVHLIRKAGSATLFYLFAAIMSYNIDDLGVTGFNKIITLLIIGVIFELVFLTFKLEIKKIQLDILLGAIVSTAFIPIIMSLLLSLDVSIKMIEPLLNLILLSIFISIISTVLSFLLWYKLKIKKFILRFEYT